MEISRVNKAGVRQTAATTERKPEQGTASAGKSNRTDQLTLSKQALAYVEEQARAALERGQGEADALTGREGSSEDSLLDALDKAMKRDETLQ